MDRLRPWLRFAMVLALAWCALKASWWVFVAFVIPDHACYQWISLDDAIAIFASYTALLVVLVARFSGAPRATLGLSSLCLVGVMASLVIRDIPETRVPCVPRPSIGGARR